MKKLFCIACLAMTSLSAQAQWLLDLNDGSTNPKLGTSTNDPLSFYTRNNLRMTLDASGNLGIGKNNPAASLDVVGDGIFSGNLRIQNSFSFSDNFKLQYTPATTGQPNLFVATPFPAPTQPHKYFAPCNVWYKDPTQYDPYTGAASSAAWTPPTANIVYDLMQVYQSGTQLSSLSLGIMNGDGILGLEALPTNPSTTQRLKINPGCANDVFICEGGGYTKMFNGAGVLGDMDVSNRVKIGAAPFGTQASLEIKVPSFLTKILTASSASVTALDISNTGKTSIGPKIQTNTAVLTVGQASKTDAALCLTDNTSTTNKDFFNVYGNGYTEIKVYNPLGMPTPYGTTNARAFTIRDMANNKDLFVVRSDGKAYAREVEINLTANFPDYVFDAGYPLKSIPEIAQYISDNKHLPNFEKGAHYEASGINVSDLLVRQQKEIEEQMLYIIALEKRLAALEKNKK